MPKLTDWSCVAETDWYKAPELIRLCLSGIVTGHSQKTDGTRIVTSRIIAASGRTITTKNTVYKLGRISKDYRRHLRRIRPNWDWRNPITIKANTER